MEETAIWRGVDGWPGYEVSDTGLVRSWKVSRQSPGCPLPRQLATWALPRGYILVTLKDGPRRKNFYVHKLVMETFVGPCPAGMEVAHEDGEEAHNHLTNLRYATPKQNSDDILRHGNRQRGAAHYAATLTDEQVIAIRAFRGTNKECAAAFGIRYLHACHIRARRIWRHL